MSVRTSHVAGGPTWDERLPNEKATKAPEKAAHTTTVVNTEDDVDT